MYLYLVQHAESMSKEQDPDRPLTEKGLADINRMARYAASHLAVDIRRIYHSGKLRAHPLLLVGRLRECSQETPRAPTCL